MTDSNNPTNTINNSATPEPKEKRAPNWLPIEEEQLAVSWVHISEEPEFAANQSGDVSLCDAKG
jgi:hypothetical protein